jgi:hypothetical protein
MRGRKTSLRVVLTAEGRSHLEQRLRSTTISLGLAWLGLAVSRDPRSCQRTLLGRRRTIGRLDGEAREEVGPAVPEGSPRRTT